MEEQTLRTIGASVILAGVVIAGAFQVASGASVNPTEIEATRTPVEMRFAAESLSPSTTLDERFVYRIGVLAGADTNNFWAYYGRQPSVWNSYILGPTKPALYSMDPVTSALEPELIVADVTPTWNSDGWRVRFDLNQDYSWSDGTPIRAQDFVFTFRTVRELGLSGSWAQAFPAEVASVHADGEYRVRIEFTERPNLSVWPYGVGQAPIMARHIWESLTAEATEETLYDLDGAGDVSGGLLTLATISDSLITSIANPGYPGELVPDTVEYHVYPDESALVDAVASGDIDIILNPKGLTPDHLANVADEAVSVQTSPANGIRYLGFNLARAPMSDRSFREALALLIDREALSAEIPHTGEPAWSLVPGSNTQWFDPAAAASSQERTQGSMSERLSRALDVLRSAGYAWETEPATSANGAVTPGEGLTIDGIPPAPLSILTPGDAYDPARPKYVGRIAETLRQLGFDARPVETDFDTVVDLAFTPGEDGQYQYDMYFLGWTLGNPALPGFHRPFFASGGALNNTGYSSEKFSSALERYENAYSIMEAKVALWSMERTLAADLPYLPLYTSELTEIFRSDTVGFGIEGGLGGLQGRLGGIGDVRPAD